jgi:hypothetical protein
MQHQHRILLPALHGKIEMPVSVEVARCDAVGMRAARNGNVTRLRQRTAAIAQQQRQIISLVIGNGDVGPAIFVEIPGCKIRRIAPGGKRRSCSSFESSSAVTEVNRHCIGVSGNDVRLSIPIQIADRDSSTSNRKGGDLRLT